MALERAEIFFMLCARYSVCGTVKRAAVAALRLSVPAWWGRMLVCSSTVAELNAAVDEVLRASGHERNVWQDFLKK